MANESTKVTSGKIYFQGNEITPIDWDEMTDARDYVLWDDDLKAAAQVALALGKPLLLTGEPGVGKSEFSRWLAEELQLGERQKFVVKSSTEATDLFYQYDTLARFHDAQISSLERGNVATKNFSKQDFDPLRYISYNALGVAMLYSVGKQLAVDQGFISDNMEQDFPGQPTRTVVLIDEIDKAPRDVPNDILDEIDKMTFTVRENRNRTLKAGKQHRPVVIIRCAPWRAKRRRVVPGRRRHGRMVGVTKGRRSGS